MLNEGPQLELLLHRLTDCPEEFLLPPLGAQGGMIHVPALVADHFRALGLEPTGGGLAGEPGHLSLVALAMWLLHDDWFLARPDLAAATAALLGESLAKLSQVVTAQQCVRDPDRREEFARVCLRSLALRPAGESLEQAQDRGNTLDSIERGRVMRDTRAAEARARQVREQMAKRAAEEAAAKTTRE
jgi:hypothetical protein